MSQGFLPRTEWTGETDYSRRIAEAYALELSIRPELQAQDHPVTRESLLATKPTTQRAANEGAPGGAAAAA